LAGQWGNHVLFLGVGKSFSVSPEHPKQLLGLTHLCAGDMKGSCLVEKVAGENYTVWSLMSC
jgi:hypothetical protein